MAYVYRYTDLADNIIKYVGIVYGENRTLKQRVYEHFRDDEWCEGKQWKIEYINVKNRTDAEHFESHFIAIFKTYQYYNDAKSNWGESDYLPTEVDWIEYKQDNLYLNTSNIVDLYEVTFDEHEKIFKVNKIKAIDAICKKKKYTNELFCKRCGCNDLELRKSKNNKMLLTCTNCNTWVGMCSRFEREYYQPQYIGDYEYENGKLIEYHRYVLKENHGEVLQENDLNSCKCKNGIYYVYGFNSEVCKSIIVNKINTRMSYTNEQILSVKEMLKRLKNELLQEKQSLDIILNT